MTAQTGADCRPVLKKIIATAWLKSRNDFFKRFSEGSVQRSLSLQPSEIERTVEGIDKSGRKKKQNCR